MRKRVFIILLAVALMMPVFPVAGAEEIPAETPIPPSDETPDETLNELPDGAHMVTITFPDGTVVQMTMEDFLFSFFTLPDDSEAEEPATDTMAADAVITVAEVAVATAEPAPTMEPEVANPWPSYILPKYTLEFENVIVPETYRVQAYCGPSRNYAEVGAYKPYQASRLDGLFMEGTYILVEMNYPSVGLRRLYFNRGVIDSTSGVPEVTLAGYPAITTASLVPRFGPGGQYDPYEDASIGANTPLTVFFEENGYVFAEFEAGFKLVRAWISAGGVKPE